MGEPGKTEAIASPELKTENVHKEAMSLLMQATEKKVEGYVDSRIADNGLFIKDLNLGAGALLVGTGIWQLVSGNIMNIFDAVNIFNIPYFSEIGQMYIDIDAPVKTIVGSGIIANTRDSYNGEDEVKVGKIDGHLVKAYVKDAMKNISFGGRKHE